ncbi:MAG TPA: ABC transporter permease [Xanthobacteraceae bacterium]
MASVEAPTEGAAAPNAADPAAPRRRARAPWFSPDNVVSMQVSRILFALVVLGAWQYGADRWFDSFFFSTPLKIFVQVGHELIDPGFYNDLWVTGFEMGVGFAIGAGGGIALGVLLARWAYVAKVLDPFLLALYSIPRVALAPMLIVWFGIGYSSKIFLGATLVFFITFFNTLAGIRSVDKALCDIARVMQATEWQVFLKVMLPSASSWILTSVKISLPFALVGVILGEYLVSSQGLGFRLNTYSTNYNITGAMAIVFLMMVLMLLLTMVTNTIEARVLRWRPKSAAEPVAQA